MRTGFLIGLLAVTAACSPPAQDAVFGQWRVTGTIYIGESAMSRAEAESWRGRVASYGKTHAQFAEHACDRPRYGVGYWPASGLYGGARLRDLGIADDSAMVVEVRCPTQPQTGSDPRWQVPGAFLIVKDRDHLLMVWQGLYFELTRQ